MTRSLSSAWIAASPPDLANAFNTSQMLPSWYLIATEDEAIPPPAQQMFAQRMGATTIEVPSSHVAMVSHPKDVIRLTEMASEALAANR